MSHDDLNDLYARRLLAELSGSTVHSYSMKKRFLKCEICDAADWRPVLDAQGQRFDGLFACRGCNAVYNPDPEPPAMGRREPGEAPDLKTGWKKLDD